MTSLPWQTSLQDRQCHALCMLDKTSKCWTTDIVSQLVNQSSILSWGIFLPYGPYMVHHPMWVGTVRSCVALPGVNDNFRQTLTQLRTCQSWSMSRCAPDWLNNLRSTHVILRTQSIFSGVCNHWAKGHSWLQMMQNTSLWLKCWKLRCRDFCTLAD